MTFSRRPDPRFNRGRIASGAPVSSAMSPAQLTAAMLAATAQTNIWLVHGDAGVNQATIAGRVSSLTSQGGANDWTTVSTTAEPSYTASDSSLGGKGTWRGDGTVRGLRNAYNPPIPSTQPHYRIGVFKLNTWVSLRAPYIAAATNRFGVRTHTSIRAAAESLNATVGGTLDLPTQQWCIVEEYFSGSTSDFTIIGPVDNIQTGVNLGTVDPVSLAMFSSNVPAVWMDTSAACSAGFLGLPSAPERATLRSTLLSYYGSQLLRTRKVCRYFCVGDSITRNALATNNDGWRKSLYDTFFTGLGYPVYSVGSTVDGTYPSEWTRHGGISGTDIAGCSTYLLDPTTGQLRAGGQLDGSVQLLPLMIGTNNMSTYAAGTTAAAYRTLLDGIQAAQPNVRMVVTTIIPQGASGNNGNVILFNAELPAVWDAFDAANPTKTLIRWDANTAIGGPSYVSANYGDDLHPNDTGHGLLGTAICSAISSVMNALTTF